MTTFDRRAELRDISERLTERSIGKGEQMMDADYIEQQCESCKEWASPDDQEIDLIETGAWAGSWLCTDCQLGEAAAL